MSGEEKSVELFRQDGEEFRSVRASLREDQFMIDTQDMGKAVEAFWGDSDYEFWTIVPKEAWGQLLMAFSIEFFANDPRATDRLRDICATHGVPYDRGSWA
ncbi:hypothetical protein K1X12_12495 [Hyphomonas sp. WL0036]|uniref:hypothetical protein n=1 Tax=Hyphomonas sediminis TaxID=2866160 RepID=UPI001C80F5B4|nr:hypothetical protein [Hyphomonas sediminis]MBY9067723.1 hypothetical protein [Hyphomonas sediminis]